GRRLPEVPRRLLGECFAAGSVLRDEEALDLSSSLKVAEREWALWASLGYRSRETCLRFVLVCCANLQARADIQLRSPLLPSESCAEFLRGKGPAMMRPCCGGNRRTRSSAASGRRSPASRLHEPSGRDASIRQWPAR